MPSVTNQMSRKRSPITSFAFVLALLPSLAAAEGRFCVVTNNMQNCWFYDANQCRQAAERQGGMCVLNQGQQQPQLQSPDIAGSMMKGMEAGRRARIEDEEHAARMRLLEAQAKAATPALGQTGQTSWEDIATAMEASRGKKRIVYTCNGVEGYIPVRGCVVTGYEDP